MSVGYENKMKDHEEEQDSHESYPFSVAVRFRGEGKPYSFGSYTGNFHKDDWVVVETQQGLEMGQVQTDALSIEKYALHMPTKPVLRRATEEDHEDFEDNLKAEGDAFDVCRDEIERLDLKMHLISAQYTLDRAKILFIYLADQRVDFRELLKKLGSTLHCRIELRQIGERDKAKMVGGLGMCGMECCCSRFKTHFDVISINMAKNQLLALNIDKLSGSCGKLKCCLKYEDNDYREMTEGLPKMGSQVEYDGEVYRVMSMNVIGDEAKLENRDEVIFVSLKDLREKGIPRKGVVMKKKNEDGAKKVIHKMNSSHEGGTKEKAHVSYDLKTPESNEKKDVRSFGKNNHHSNNNGSHQRHNSGNAHRHTEEPAASNKNVTVRTFGKKKKED
jgi:cell fate regulator YaaT (PSP1 superfamily)